MCNWLYVWYENGPLSAEEIADHFSTILRTDGRPDRSASAETIAMLLLEHHGKSLLQNLVSQRQWEL